MRDETKTRDLLTRATQGDGRALDELVAEYLPSLVVYLRLHAGRLVLEKESCSDLAQSVCREVLENVGRFEYRGEAPFRKWLFQKAASKIVDRQRYHLADMRHPAREVRGDGDGTRAGLGLELARVFASVTSPSEVAMRDEDLERLEAAFAQLSDEQREVVTRSRLYGESHAEIARDLGKSEGATRVLLHRALVRMGYLMGVAGASEGDGLSGLA